MPSKARYGRDDVFIYPLWRKVGKKIKMSLDEFKRWLVEQNRLQNLALVRADLVEEMDPDLVERSEIEDLGAHFHFVIDPRSRRQGIPTSPPQPRPQPTRTLLDDVAEVREAIHSIRGAGRFGDRKVFISEVWKKIRGKMGMSLDEFKRWLVHRNRSQDLSLARADLVSAMDPALVEASETYAVPGERFPVYHFVIDDSVG
jgi:GNAT superfamily N-acetyltransferase